jgi:hypothetical protein
MEMIVGLQVSNPRLHTPHQFYDPCPEELDADIWSENKTDTPLV